MRPYWKGYLKLALVSCPIALRAWIVDFTARPHFAVCESVSVGIEPVCGTPKRKLKNGEQRLASHMGQSRLEILKVADQRL